MSFFEKVNKMSNEEFIKAFPDSELLLKSYVDFKKCISDELEHIIKTSDLLFYAGESMQQRFDELSPEQQDIKAKEFELQVIIMLKKANAVYEVTSNVLTGIFPAANEMCKHIINHK